MLSYDLGVTLRRPPAASGDEMGNIAAHRFCYMCDLCSQIARNSRFNNKANIVSHLRRSTGGPHIVYPPAYLPLIAASYCSACSMIDISASPHPHEHTYSSPEYIFVRERPSRASMGLCKAQFRIRREIETASEGPGLRRGIVLFLAVRLGRGRSAWSN